MTTNKSVERSHAPQETATDCDYVDLQAIVSTVGRKQVHRMESRMEYYWELRSNNPQNIKAVMCPLYKKAPFEKEVWIGSRELTRKA